MAKDMGVDHKGRGKETAVARPGRGGVWTGLSVALMLMGGVWAGDLRAEGVTYRARIEGVENQALLSALQGVARTLTTEAGQAPGLLILKRRMAGERERFLELLHAQGYFGARLESRLVSGETPPVEVVYAVDPGVRYGFGRVRLRADPDPGVILPETAGLGLVQGEPALSSRVLDAEEKLLRQVREQGFAFAAILPRDAVVDPDRQTLDLDLGIQPGPFIRLGEPRIQGMETERLHLVRRSVTWKTGDPFRPQWLEETQRNLSASGLFGTARVELAEAPSPDGLWPVEIRVVERPPRTREVGVGFDTDRGPFLSTGWTHRNLLGRAERLELRAEISHKGEKGAVTFDKPDFLGPHRSLVLNGTLGQETTGAFEERALNLGAGLKQPGPWNWILSYGVAHRLFELEEATVRRRDKTFALVSLPLLADRDASDDPLDPTHGWKLSLQATPYQETLENGVTFLKLRSRGSAYLPLREDRRLVLAQRLGAGVMSGARRDEVPASERFFAGGGGSLRGYGYQLASPLDPGNKPEGGLSIFETATELRGRLTDSMGAVVFLDGAEAYKQEKIDLGQGMLWGAGLGMRYLSPVGPLRLDLAMPVHRRGTVDDPFQIYVSFGQAF